MSFGLPKLMPRTLSAMFLVAGTCIGGGMLALPVATGVSGFYPSIVLMITCWAAMTLTALYLTEAGLWMPEGAHIISMSNRFLGFPGKAASWCLFLFMSYASLVAYIAGGGHLLARALEGLSLAYVSKEMGCVFFTLFFGAALYLGNHVIGRVNSLLFTGMIGAYILLIGLGCNEVKTELLERYQWKSCWMAIPLLLTSFSFQTIVPSLYPYLNRHPLSLKVAIIGGTALTLIIYLLWQYVVLGSAPLDGPNGLLEALKQGEPATQFLGKAVESKWIEPIAHYFAFFALVTSFLGMAMGLGDFLSDGCKIPRKGWGNTLIACLILFPCLFFAIRYERAFLTALDTTGGFGDTILNGIIPILMVWMGRYHFRLNGTGFKVWGGKILLIIVCAFYIASLGVGIISFNRGVDTYMDIEDSIKISEETTQIL